jgi:hypothetical protein
MAIWGKNIVDLDIDNLSLFTDFSWTIIFTLNYITKRQNVFQRFYNSRGEICVAVQK